MQAQQPSQPHRLARRALVWMAVAGIALLVASLLWPRTELVSARLSPDKAGWAGVGNPFAAGVSSQTQALDYRQPPETPSHTLPDLTQSSLAGTQADGDWGVDTQGRLQASHALRQRFDYYLSLIGEVPLPRIRTLVLQSAQASVPPAATESIMAMWDKYVQLQQHNWKNAVDLRQPASWSAALIERQNVRRQALGADWAQAFYSEEERHLQDMLQRRNAGQNGAEPATDQLANMPALHPQAIEREAVVQAQWQAWEQRLDAARSHLLTISQAPELSALQRNQAAEQYLNSTFEGVELVRARALLRN
jgi:lipase chaperone LimK